MTVDHHTVDREIQFKIVLSVTVGSRNERGVNAAEVANRFELSKVRDARHRGIIDGFREQSDVGRHAVVGTLVPAMRE